LSILPRVGIIKEGKPFGGQLKLAGEQSQEEEKERKKEREDVDFVEVGD
jgi:hypothetical protein